MKKFIILLIFLSVNFVHAQEPHVKLYSASAFALYKNCGNKVMITAPELGDRFKPTYEIEGGTYIERAPGLLAVIPTATAVKLTIINEGKVLSEESMRVREIPSPTITILHNGKAINLEEGITDMSGNLEWRVDPFKDFAKHFPEDARYRVTKWSIAHMRGSEQLNIIRTGSLRVDLSTFTDVQPGDYLLLKFVEVQRLNYQSKREMVRLNEQSKIRVIFLK